MTSLSDGGSYGLAVLSPQTEQERKFLLGVRLACLNSMHALREDYEARHTPGGGNWAGWDRGTYDAAMKLYSALRGMARSQYNAIVWKANTDFWAEDTERCLTRGLFAPHRSSVPGERMAGILERVGKAHSDALKSFLS